MNKSALTFLFSLCIAQMYEYTKQQAATKHNRDDFIHSCKNRVFALSSSALRVTFLNTYSRAGWHVTAT